MISSAAGDDINFVNVSQKFWVPLQLRKYNTAAVFSDSLIVILSWTNLLDEPAHCISNCLGLLTDLLEHEMFVAALLGRLSIPTDIENLLVNGISIAVYYIDRILLDDCNFTIVENVCFASSIYDRRNI